MPHFIYRIQLTEKYRDAANRDAAFEQTVGEHFNYLKTLMDEGVVWMAGRADVELESPDNFGICVFEVASADEALNFSQNDPAIKKGVMEFRVLPFSLALWKDK